MKNKQRLTVITNSIEIVLELSEVPGFNIISTGGSLKEGYLALLGPQTEEAISSYYADKAFVSCKGLNDMSMVLWIRWNCSHGREKGNHGVGAKEDVMLDYRQI